MPIPRSTRRALQTVLLALVISLAAVPFATAAGSSTYPMGSQVTFSARTSGANPPGGVFVRVAARRGLDRYGQLKQTKIGTFAQMHKRGPHLFKYTTPAYTFDSWFMNRPGTYYWQTQYADCSFSACKGHGVVHVFHVR